MCLCNNAPYSRPILMKIEFSRHISEKCSYIKFHEYLSSERRALPLGQRHREMYRQTGGRTVRERERHDEASSCFPQFSEAPLHGITLTNQLVLNSKTWNYKLLQ